MKSVEQKQLLLDGQFDESDDDRSIIEERDRPKQVSLRRCLVFGLIIQALLITTYTLACLYIIRRATDTDSDPDIHAFAGLAVRYKFRLYDNFVNSPYAGEPTPESDAAWHTLLNNMSVRVTEDELAAHNQTSVALPNGGYLAWLGVFHELHCVKMLRQWSWREHYFPNMTAHEHMHQMVHIDHCLDWLRNAATCRADTSALAVFKWDGRLPHPMLNTKRVPHRCVDWDAMMSSHADRLVSHKEIESLRNPILENGDNSVNTEEVEDDKLPWVSADDHEKDNE